MPKRLLIISQEYPPRTGGAGVVAKQNAEGLAALGHEVTVLTRTWGDYTEYDSRVKIAPIGGVRKLWPFYMAKKLRALNPESYDAIILNDVGAAFVFATFFRFERYAHKCLLYLHGGEVQSVLGSPKGYIKWTRFLGRYIKLAQACKQIVAVSNYMKNYFLAHFPAPLDEDRIAVVYAGVDERIFHPVPSQVRQELGLKPDSQMLVSVGRIIKEKGFPRMLRLFSEALRQNPLLFWAVIGDGPYLEELKHEANKIGVGSNIRFLGRIDRQMLPLYYSAADLFWLLSERESFGLVYAEAQMCGCPALGPAKYGVVEAIAHGRSGFLVESDEDCLNVLVSGGFRSIDRDATAQFARRFALGGQTRALVRVLNGCKGTKS